MWNWAECSLFQNGWDAIWISCGYRETNISPFLSLGKIAFSVSHPLKERALCLRSVLLCPITSIHHFSGPLTSGTVSASFCSVGLMLLWRSDIRRLWLRWAIKSRWSLHNPWVSHCALFLGTRVIIINGRVIGWANMQVFRGDLQSTILSKEIQPPSRATQRHPDWLLFMNTVLIPRVIVLIWLMKWWC